MRTKSKFFSNLFFLLLSVAAFTLVFKVIKREPDPDPYKIITDPELDLEAKKHPDPAPEHF
jgi:hypothetical protein